MTSRAACETGEETMGQTGNCLQEDEDGEHDEAWDREIFSRSP